MRLLDEKQYIPHTPLDGLVSTSIWAWRFNGRPLMGASPRSSRMPGVVPSGSLGAVRRGLGMNGCPVAHMPLPDGRCVPWSPPSAMFPMGWPASAMMGRRR